MLIIGGLLALAGAINTVGAAAEKIAKGRAALKAPNTTQDERLNRLDGDMVAVKRCLDNDKRRLDKLDEGNHVTQQALFALLSHAIDGNNVSGLKNAQEALHDFLIYGKSKNKTNTN